MGWTRYEQLARHVDVNCTGKTEDPRELPLMTTTTTIKTSMHRYTGASNIPQCQQIKALPYINANHRAVTDALSLKVKLTDGLTSEGQLNDASKHTEKTNSNDDTIYEPAK